MIAYRVEHKDAGCGPYNIPIGVADEIGYDAYWEVVDAVYVCRQHCSGDNHPGPREEWAHWDHSTHSGNYLFGFESLEQLHEWFDEHTREVLAEVGFVIKTYRMDNFMKGRAQIAFEILTSEPLTTIPLVG